MLLLLAGCGPAQLMTPAGSSVGHEFVLNERPGRFIRKISFWSQPGHILMWQLVRAADEARKGIPLTFLDYGEVPAAMEQVFPEGRPQPLREGQTVVVGLEYSPDADVDPVVPNEATGWYRKDSGGFKEVSELEPSGPTPGKDGDKKPKQP